MTSKDGPKPIADIVKSVFGEIEKGKILSRDEVTSRWKEIVGEDALKHATPMTLRKGILTVTVDSSVWMHEMIMRQRKFLKALQSAFGKDKISRLHFKIGEM
ncbi:MAG: DUF721 domain-containing protein [Candidatus Omnitrophica bacterium]|nr:DUF721 domain-containing protein [Candidatus Omnitrophota bacterium]